MLKSKLFYLIILIVLIAGFFAWQLFAYKVDEPKYKILQADGNIEVREYGSIIVAQVTVQGDRYKAINKGFRLLAGYIFGGNKAKQEIAMTAPVTQESVKIDMTAPVMQQQDGKDWIVRFVMPAEFTMKTLPVPNNEDVKLIEVPAKKYAVIKFSGRNTNKNLSKHEELLKEYIAKNNLTIKSQATAAFYNPPWILPFLRRNEIMIEVD